MASGSVARSLPDMDSDTDQVQHREDDEDGNEEPEPVRGVHFFSTFDTVAASPAGVWTAEPTAADGTAVVPERRA